MYLLLITETHCNQNSPGLTAQQLSGALITSVIYV